MSASLFFLVLEIPAEELVHKCRDIFSRVEILIDVLQDGDLSAGYKMKIYKAHSVGILGVPDSNPN